MSTSRSSFDAADHPRGQPGNSGQFRSKPRTVRNSEADDLLRSQGQAPISVGDQPFEMTSHPVAGDRLFIPGMGTVIDRFEDGTASARGLFPQGGVHEVLHTGTFNGALKSITARDLSTGEVVEHTVPEGHELRSWTFYKIPPKPPVRPRRPSGAVRSPQRAARTTYIHDGEVVVQTTMDDRGREIHLAVSREDYEEADGDFSRIPTLAQRPLSSSDLARAREMM